MNELRHKTRNQRPREVRSITLKRSDLRAWASVDDGKPHLPVLRPATRGECPEVRPCPFVGCRYNLFLDVGARGELQFNFPDLDPDEMDPRGSCALDVAERGGINLEDTAKAMNVVRERVRQIELDALAQLRVVPGSEQLEEHCETRGIGRGEKPHHMPSGGAAEG